MASGLDIIYPSENTGLARRIVESGQGALLTEFPLGVKPDSKNFPARNRIISGLSQGILVTEAPKQKGVTQSKAGWLVSRNAACGLVSTQLQLYRKIHTVPASLRRMACSQGR